jgi:hypothetical protein
MKTLSNSKSNLGLLFVGLFISGFILLNSTRSIAEDPSKKPCPINSKRVCRAVVFPNGQVSVIRGNESYVNSEPTTKLPKM